jgi:hypothetical protein
MMTDDEQTPLFDKGTGWEEHWGGMPEFIQKQQRPFAQLIVRFRNQEDLDDFARLIGQTLNRNSQCTWHPELRRGELGNTGKHYVDES